MTTSNLLSITELASTQTGRSATVNEAIAKLETAAGHIPVIKVGIDAPPGSPSEGDVYVVGTSPSGAWVGHSTDIAVYYNGSWLFLPARTGMHADSSFDDIIYRYKLSYGWEALINAGNVVSQTQQDFISGAIPSSDDKTIILVINSPTAFTISATTTKCTSGSGTATFKIGGVALGGSANDVSSSEDIQSHATNNVVNIGDDLELEISNDSPAIADMSFTVAFNYELA